MQNLAENFDNSVREDDSEDTRNSLAPGRRDTEGEIDAKLKDLNELLHTNVTSVLQVPEVKKDKLKVPVQPNLLSRIIFSLQEFSSKELNREFYDFAHRALRAEHNDVVHRVEDLATKQGKMTAEEKRDFGKFQLQTNRQRRNLFSLVRIPVIH